MKQVLECENRDDAPSTSIVASGFVRRADQGLRRRHPASSRGRRRRRRHRSVLPSPPPFFSCFPAVLFIGVLTVEQEQE